MSETQTQRAEKYNNFIKLNRELLECYATIIPDQYKGFTEP
jgi:hypothetical protein